MPAVHVDIKNLGSTPDGGGHKTLGRQGGRKNRRNAGYSFIYTAIDAHPSLARSAVHAEEKKGDDHRVLARGTCLRPPTAQNRNDENALAGRLHSLLSAPRAHRARRQTVEPLIRPIRSADGGGPTTAACSRPSLGSTAPTRPGGGNRARPAAADRAGRGPRRGGSAAAWHQPGFPDGMTVIDRLHGSIDGGRSGAAGVASGFARVGG